MSERVLLVDDDQDFLEIMSERLVARGFDVDTSTSGKDALARVDRGEPFDAVILDLKMPGMDGIEALKRMREKRPEVQVILLTGHATVEKGVEAIKMGALDFVEKPADLEAIGEKIRKASKQKMLIVDKMDYDRVVDVLQRYGM